MSSIQHYFSIIRLANIRSYLLAHGWEISDMAPENQILFLGPMHDQGSRYELFFPENEGHPKFRDRVQRSIFNLSCIEDREPIEIATEMAAAKQAASAKSSGGLQLSGGTEVLAVENRGVGPLLVHVIQTAAELELQVGDGIEIHVEREQPGRTLVQYGEHQLTFNAEGAQQLRLYQIRLGGGTTGPLSLSEAVRIELRGGQWEEPPIAEILADMKATFSRAEFALAAGIGGAIPLQVMRQQVALIVAALAARLPKPVESASASILWRVACRMLNHGDVAMRLSGNGERELGMVAAADDELAPHQTLSWLTINTRGGSGE